MSGILFKKWYLDCVDHHGQSFFGYSAELRWHSIHIHFQSYLHYSDHTGIATDFSLRRHSFPHVQSASIEWNAIPIGVKGIWKPLCPPIHRNLFTSEGCTMQWDCIQPHSDCTVHIGDRTILHGRGYVECLEVRLAEWGLPLRELRWGRFLSGDVSLVWIDWAGDNVQHLLFWNSMPVDHCTIGNEFISIPDREATLTLHRHAVLKESSILPPSLQNIPGVAAVIPLTVARSHEAKWLSFGTLHQNHAPDRTGWAIHERVVFQ